MKKMILHTFCCLLGLCIEGNVFAQATNKLDSTGNVGIGTTDPVCKLSIKSASQHIRLENGSEEIGLVNLGTSGNLDLWAHGDNSTDIFRFITGTGSGTVRITIGNTGNLGIGTTDPNNIVHIKAPPGHLSQRFEDATVGTIGFVGGANGIITDAAAGNMAIRAENGLYITASGNSANMFIKPGGNVGIGTTSPSEKLSVDGNVYASGNISAFGFIKTKKLTVTQTEWPDYVFAEEYKLRSLSSLEAFIKQNNHLPEVPSAKEVEEKGINVGDNQALLLKKIEEMTLYLIELKKENQAQQKEIEKLKMLVTPAKQEMKAFLIKHGCVVIQRVDWLEKNKTWKKNGTCNGMRFFELGRCLEHKS